MLEVYFVRARSFGTLSSLSAALGRHDVYEGHEGLQVKAMKASKRGTKKPPAPKHQVTAREEELMRQ